MWPNTQFPEDLVTFTEEILNRKFHFLCSEKNSIIKGWNYMSREPYKLFFVTKKIPPKIKQTGSEWHFSNTLITTLVFQVNLKDTTCYISKDSLGVYLSPKYLLFCTVFWENFQICSAKITGKWTCNSKYWIYSLLLMVPSIAGFYHHLSGRRKLPTFLRQHFRKYLLPPAERGKGKKLWPKKMAKINLVRVRRQFFVKSHHFFSFHFFSFSFVLL